MQTHEQIMQTFLIFSQEIERKEEFRKTINQTLQEYDYYKIKNLMELEDKSQWILQDTIAEIAKKSMKSTDLYFHIEKENFDLILNNIESEDFKYELYYIDTYNNLLKDIVYKFWSPNVEKEKIVSKIIEKSVEFSVEKTKQTFKYIKDYDKNWEVFIDKQILFYKLEESLEERNIKIPKKKI